MQEILLESLTRFLGAHCNSAALRRFEGGAPTAELWQQLHEFGYADAMLAEDSGGAGLGLSDIRELMLSLGRFLLPVPLAETMLARALLGAAGTEIPTGPIVLITPTSVDGTLQSLVPLALSAEFGLLEVEGRWILTPLAAAKRVPCNVHGSLAATVIWDHIPEAIVVINKAASVSLREISAALRAAQMVGAMTALIDMTIEYANTREQFGRPLAKFQALQQQLAVMAERVLGANMAVQLAFATSDTLPSALTAAIAKHTASAAVSEVTATAHAVHGAIGLSEEYDLQLFTRRLYEWRLADGSDSYWARCLGKSRLAVTDNSVDFIRSLLTPEEIH
jgi:acyl-CoA dehydrogenase